MFEGEELGLENAEIPADRVVDPGGRDGERAPIPWTPAPDHGWGVDDPWLPWPPKPDVRNVEAEQADTNSVLHLYRRLLTARRNSPALQVGSWQAVDAPKGVLAYERSQGDDRRVVIVNFTGEEQQVRVDGTWIVEVASDGSGEGSTFAGSVGPDGAVILQLS